MQIFVLEVFGIKYERELVLSRAYSKTARVDRMRKEHHFGL